MLTLFANVLTLRATCLQSSARAHINCEWHFSGRNARVAQGRAELRGSLGVQPPVQKAPNFRWVRIESFGQRLGRIADPRELGVKVVEACREGVFDDSRG